MNTKHKSVWLGTILFSLLISCQPEVKMKETNDKLKKASFLTLGNVKPHGWIGQQMQDDLENGYVGHLDELVPDLIREDDIYGKDRLTNKIKSKDVGAVGVGEWTNQILWWNSETQSNWRDGWLRHAFLTDNAEYIAKAKDFVQKILDTQDPDGYLGIYAEDLRYRFTGENGELWAQSSLFRILLAYYEFTADRKVLQAVIRAMDRTMQAYPMGKSEPFRVKQPFAGVGHGLTIVDALLQLYQLTSERKYVDYAIWLYQDYNKYDLSEVDIQPKNLLNPDYRFKGHGVHTYEHLRALSLAAYYSDQPKYRKALQAYLDRLPKYLTPSGAPIGDEFIFGRYADTGETGYEYCSLQELLDSYSLLLQLSGDLKWAERIEHLYYNAALGARHPHQHSIAYLKTDNSYSMTGTLHQGKEDIHAHNTRYSYSPTHRKAAVCCVPNAGRITPYLVKNMWMKSDSLLIKSIYGPSVLNTSIRNTPVRIIEETDYPYGLKVNYRIDVEQPLRFALRFRKPEWCSKMILKINGRIYQGNQVEKLWQKDDRVEIEFKSSVAKHSDLQGNSYFSYGPLVYAMPLMAEETITKEFGIGDFKNVNYTTPEKEKLSWKLPEKPIANFTENSNAKELSARGKIEIQLVDPKNHSLNNVELIPLSATILRKLSFESEENSLH